MLPTSKLIDPKQLAEAIARNPNHLRAGTLLPERKEHWDTVAFHNFRLERASMPFRWGQQDCALFAADGILAMTGQDIAAEFRGKYHDEATAFAAIREITGGSTVEDAAAWCADQFAMPMHRYPLMAQRGDLVVLEDPDLDDPSGQPRIIAGLVDLNGRTVVAAGELGLKRIPITAIKRAWHV